MGEFTWTGLGCVGWSIHCIRVRSSVVQDKVWVGREGDWLAGAAICIPTLGPVNFGSL